LTHSRFLHNQTPYLPKQAQLKNDCNQKQPSNEFQNLISKRRKWNLCFSNVFWSVKQKLAHFCVQSTRWNVWIFIVTFLRYF